MPSRPDLDIIQTRQDALNFAYLYGYPLVEFGKMVANLSRPKVNKFQHGRRLSTPKDRFVIRPNADTLYTSSLLDLSIEDVEVTIPHITDRYWSFALYDPYGNDIGNISTTQNHKPGTYIVRYTNENFGLSLKDPSRDGNYQGSINMPTAYGLFLARIATTHAVEDQNIVNGIQDQLRIFPVPRRQPPFAPPLDLGLFSAKGYIASKEATLHQVVLRLTAALAPHNQSPVLADRDNVARILSLSGIFSGHVENTSAADLKSLSKYALSQVKEAESGAHGKLDIGNGWSVIFPESFGYYGSDYAARYTIAKTGYLALTYDEALYPSPDEALFTKPNEAIILKFSRRPQLVENGFWSLTAYDADQFLVPNKMHRYNLGNRDDLKFLDGTPLKDANKDGPFEILMQPANLLPPKKWLNNWLPLPAGGGRSSINLRWYGAKPEMTSGGYAYPEMRYVDAITATSSKL